MTPILTYSVKIFKNFFCVSFINSETNKQSEYYALDDKKFNASILIKIVNNCLLIGYGNNSLDDIILNYIYCHEDVNVNEIYALSQAITIQHNLERELWHNKDIEFYMYRNVKSFDISETSNIDGIIKLHDLTIKEEDLDIILLNNMQDAQKIIIALNALKMRFKHGFRSTYKKPITRDTIRENYIMKLLDI